MRRTLLFTCLAFLFVTAYAQENPYIKKTRGAKHKADLQLVDHEGEDETAIDFISQNFKYQSLCEWKEGMKFMVIPNEYDLVVKTFTDAATDNDVSNVKLRHKIMIYQGHQEGDDGHEFIYFLCQDDNRKYYYDISGSFDDYCYEKKGIPTLAYLGDVDIAREKLVGKEVYTKTDIYRIDTEVDGDGYKEVIVDKDMQVKVSAVGVGTRDFPVKIIVEDKDGNEFYQNVAISKTNCSLRDDDFVQDDAKYLFGNSFELVEDVMNINSYNYRLFLGKVIHTKFPTKLLNEFSKKMQSIPRLTEYQIESMTPHKNSDKFTMKLKNTTIGTYFYIDMILDEHLAQDQTEYFGYLFALGPGKKIQTSEGSRAMIRAGHVGIGFSEDETMMAAGEPDKVTYGENGKYTWIYQRSNNKLLYVDFDGSGRVSKTRTSDNSKPKGGGASTTRHSSSAARQAAKQSMGWQSGKGTPIEN
jgi:hypothetical protein